ncbi:MAG: IclR family transcriptional regulator [Bifidobacteriaceae bacterium]|jgi:IclR family acetate operon transcriptional repressor|nr:IclR family transcriptional regulator [Bifidobacteriaceae bacterium]
MPQAPTPAPPAEPESSGARNTTVDRALRVLEQFLGTEGELGVLELSRQLDLDKSVIHRILVTLVHRRFLEQDPVTRRYRVGLRIWELGQRFLGGQPLQDLVLRELRGVVAERAYTTGFVARLDGGDMVLLHTVIGPGPMNITIDPGARLMAERTTTGLTFLSHLDPLEVERLVLARRATHTGSSLDPIDRLMARLAVIRERGYGLSDGHYTPGVGTVARVVRGASGEPLVALSIDYLIGEGTEDYATTLPDALARCVAEIERVAGGTAAQGSGPAGGT